MGTAMDGMRRRLPALGLLACTYVELCGTAQLPLAEFESKPTLAPLVRRVSPAVVNISVTGSGRHNALLDDPFWRRFFEIPEGEEVPLPRRQSAGSGVIVDAAQGYVLTNHHVVADAELIVVNLADRRELTAELIGSDEATDVALLKIDADRLTALQIGDSERLEVGDFVVAVGNSFGLGQTVTSGIVSALGRTGLGIEGYEDFIQTDAAINPGNSGGALVDLDGRLVGINSAILSAAGGNLGVGFAVPSNMALAVMTQLLEYGDIRRGRLGVMVQDVTPDLAAALALSVDRGAVVSDVENDSAAALAGIRTGDVITAVDGVPIDDAAGLRNRVGLTRAGETLAVTLLRDGRERTLDVTLGEAQSAPAAPLESRAPSTLEGVTFRELEPGDPRYGRLRGVVVVRVAPGSAAARAGLAAEDVILALNRRPIASIAELEAALDASSPPFALQVARGTTRLFIVVR
jgi:Do/DeqQ family serine protease